MRINEALLISIIEQAISSDEVSDTQLKAIEQYADRLFKTAGVDINFSSHFRDRVNDIRNSKAITANDLVDLFQKAYDQLDRGKKISRLGPDAQAVIKDMSSDINMPFVLVWDAKNRELDLVAKTIMRKKNFTTPNQELVLK